MTHVARDRMEALSMNEIVNTNHHPKHTCIFPDFQPQKQQSYVMLLMPRSLRSLLREDA